MTGTDTSLVGRAEELSRLRELVAPPYLESRTLLLLGDPGMGKTVLLAEAAREARLAGAYVLTVAGRESEQDLAFAGLHQLLRPVLDRVAGLPVRQAEALRGAFGLSDDPVPPDALLTGIAVLTLLSGLSDDAPLLVAADDAQWLDRASLDALAFAARRLESEPLVAHGRALTETPIQLVPLHVTKEAVRWLTLARGGGSARTANDCARRACDRCRSGSLT
jgi:hypothetical protein